MISADALRLSDATLPSLPGAVARPAYDRGKTGIGIVHIGVGAFHRAHQAVYIDSLLGDEPDWAICGVSLHSSEVRDALRPQDGLYTLALLGEQPSQRVIGSIRELLCARDEPAAVLARLADPAVRLVTLTITEKGYCLAGDGLDAAHPDIVRDLASPDAPRGAIGYIVAGLRLRERHGLAPYTVLSCDNLADNGGKLRRAVLQYAERIDADLAHWIDTKVAFPRSMVDSITPATDDSLRERVERELGVHDAWPVQREPYTQWVVEDRFCNGRPALERVGVTMSDDIAGYDKAKLRLLNAPHSTLAYLGSLMQLETVADAMREPLLSGFVERLMREHIVPATDLPSGFGAGGYVDAILERFRNPAIRHLLSQIAWDGSQKIPVRLLATIADALAADRPIDRLCLPVAGWLRFVVRQAQAGVPLVDPMDAALSRAGRTATGDAAHDIAAFLALEMVFAPLSGDTRFVDALRTAYAALGEASREQVASALLAATGSSHA
ncbi:mannitol dehydrogenase family protein [Pseudoxanthomonas wuyuanensis]|uniref:Fructuronate reductase n=1 Tax=Pseudoxanthomonas wuyuanensis TaxID=1073196 RepID=A0A286D8Q9_9GAMM|nr:mannitol dehydrogenase family protein [Pseudoxanthomonas wuyuanensis]KAF1720292.1 mannitol dehydrogenase family protein [Pseudoxanthomonas wuyuanensis]SOD55030.1 fructuronate reductase [Pseudoxanthomonas wuyuanensis]